MGCHNLRVDDAQPHRYSGAFRRSGICRRNHDRLPQYVDALDGDAESGPNVFDLHARADSNAWRTDADSVADANVVSAARE
jgi:hypothetical protein